MPCEYFAEPNTCCSHPLSIDRTKKDGVRSTDVNKISCFQVVCIFFSVFTFSHFKMFSCHIIFVIKASELVKTGRCAKRKTYEGLFYIYYIYVVNLHTFLWNNFTGGFGHILNYPVPAVITYGFYGGITLGWSNNAMFSLEYLIFLNNVLTAY